VDTFAGRAVRTGLRCAASHDDESTRLGACLLCRPLAGTGRLAGAAASTGKVNALSAMGATIGRDGEPTAVVGTALLLGRSSFDPSCVRCSIPACLARCENPNHVTSSIAVAAAPPKMKIHRRPPVFLTGRLTICV